jgi:hypothetical protein
MLLLTEYLGGHTGVAAMMRVKLKQKWPLPMCCMPRVKPVHCFFGPSFVTNVANDRLVLFLTTG